MEQRFSTSKVTVEYHDPHDVYKLLAPGLFPRLPLRNLHWQSHAGPLRSIDTLHIELIRSGAAAPTTTATPSHERSESNARDDGFQTQQIGGRAASSETVDSHVTVGAAGAGGAQRRHQIPGLRRTPYLKVLLVRCDDNETYKSSVRSEVREWIKTEAATSSGSKKNTERENHDAFEWLIVHVVIPNTVASTQPRTSGKQTETGSSEKTTTSSSRWRTGSTPLMEKLRSDFNSSGKGAIDRVAQIRIGINDVPYDQLPRVVPAVPTGYSETEQDAENAWKELIGKLKSQILQSFDSRVTQYEEDIKERDLQRALPGWNFCTFFMLKEGLARGFESVGLVEDALVGYDELSVGLDSVFHEQTQTSNPVLAIRTYTDAIREAAEKAAAEISGGDGADEEAVNLQASQPSASEQFDAIAISATKKPYRDMILENKVSHFDFRCYIFSRQIELLLRLANASSTREELLAKLKEQQESVLYGEAPMAQAAPQVVDEREDLTKLGEICQRSLEFIPAISQIMRQDIAAAWASRGEGEDDDSWPLPSEVVDNLVSSFAFSIAQQILAQTSTKALPIPPSSLPPTDAGHDKKSSIPDPKTTMLPARTSSLSISTGPTSGKPPASPSFFPGPGATGPAVEHQQAQFAKAGLEYLSGKRAELYMLSRSLLDGLGTKRGWSNGWDEAPMLGYADIAQMEDVNLDDDDDASSQSSKSGPVPTEPSLAGIDSQLLRTAIDSSEDFYRLYEILTDKAMRHYLVAGHEYSVQANKADLAVMKVHLGEYRAAAKSFAETTQFFGEGGWSLLELSMLTMFARCLRELHDKDTYVRVALKLLIKACAAENERLQERRGVRLGLEKDKKEYPDMQPLVGVVGQLLELALALQSERKALLANFFTNTEVEGAPVYDEGKDSCVVRLKIQSLLPEEIKFDSAMLRATSVEGGAAKEIWFHAEDTVLKPGINTLTARCTSVVPGRYSLDRLDLRSGKLTLEWERDATQPPERDATMFRKPGIVLYQRAGALDVDLKATKHTALDKDNCLDLTLSTGWNDLQSCEIRMKPATGGLRLLGTEARIIDSTIHFAQVPEAGHFVFKDIPAGTSLTLQFPYSLEQDVADVLARIEVHYTLKSDEEEEMFFAKMVSAHVSLALGVNVQDVFKHSALFSRFNVTTASASPLRLFASELIESELYHSSTPSPITETITVFPKQSASLLYKVHRKQGGKLTGKKAARTMYLKVHYSVLEDEAREIMEREVKKGLEGGGLGEFVKPVWEALGREVKSKMSAKDLERAALLGSVTTAFLKDVSWERHFSNFGTLSSSKSSTGIASALDTFLKSWVAANPQLELSNKPVEDPASILIPVEVPSVSIVHTADIKLRPPPPTASLGFASKMDNSPLAEVNTLLPATLHLKWTRQWCTSTSPPLDLEFSYEVTASSDTWLLGGRRKGHFVIPADSEVSSTVETEAEIGIMMVPLREGWLPFPGVDVREVREGSGEGEGEGEDGENGGGQGGCEVDYRNIGEVVRVLDGRRGVSVSLDASGPGGGPLVLGVEK